ncbi:polysaccharide pyruvyl transferase family protein [Acidimicrobiia bacterium EGI L10123]|uniref:polysaccharide pyruvyl transferase family protein n=1 Tax=Salinilacustrithrix flava TaxID=2957203 RepID=UPI003D7C18B3|nr:polysaccharide pyruvyl transferase family protein [Acidimicrobiia bacterium EGI L10123]
MTVGVLTVAPWHNSIGDIATAEVTIEHLADAGIPARHVSDTDEYVSTLVIGGGNLLNRGDDDRWGRLLRRFRTPGPHILNACGITFDVDDFSFLSDHRLVTVRDLEIANRIRPTRPDVEAVPCPATLLRPYDWDFAIGLPGYEHLSHLRPGEYVVAHRHALLAAQSRMTDMPVLVVDAQAWETHE